MRKGIVLVALVLAGCAALVAQSAAAYVKNKSRGLLFLSSLEKHLE